MFKWKSVRNSFKEMHLKKLCIFSAFSLLRHEVWGHSGCFASPSTILSTRSGAIHLQYMMFGSPRTRNKNNNNNSKSSAIMILSACNEDILVFPGNKFQQPVTFQCIGINRNTSKIFMLSNKFQHHMGQLIGYSEILMKFLRSDCQANFSDWWLMHLL